MTTFYLVRHGENDFLGRGLAGRTPGVSLNDAGRRQAIAVADALAAEGVTHVVTSPLERTRETAAPLAARLGLTPESSDDVLEVDFGAWTGRSWDELFADPLWAPFNAFRAGNRPPGGGETSGEVQARVVARLLALRERHPDGRVAVFSHGDPLRVALAFFLGMPLDFILRFEVSPGSISALELGQDWVRVLYVNRVPGGGPSADPAP